jgi:hypothetical protein
VTLTLHWTRWRRENEQRCKLRTDPGRTMSMELNYTHMYLHDCFLCENAPILMRASSGVYTRL